jgi:hypothetical protein
MQTDDLIRSLAGNLAPVSRTAVERRIALGILIGATVTLVAIALRLGVRPDLGAAMQGFPFWMKWIYTLSLAIGAIAATIHLSRPDAPRMSWLWLLAVPVFILAALAASELAQAPAGSWPALLQGRSASRCSLFVLAFSAPIYAGLVWAFRSLAPTNMRLAGAMAGLASGACAATLYGLHCPEASATFVLAWYTLGMVLAMIGGALAAPRFLRW